MAVTSTLRMKATAVNGSLVEGTGVGWQSEELYINVISTYRPTQRSFEAQPSKRSLLNL